MARSVIRGTVYIDVDMANTRNSSTGKRGSVSQFHHEAAARARRESGRDHRAVVPLAVHAGDASVITGYLGRSVVFDEAVTEFANGYADINEADHGQHAAAIRSGRIDALSDI